METTKKKIALLGCGALGSAIAEGIRSGKAGSYILCGILAGSDRETQAAADDFGCTAYQSLAALLEDRPDFVIEAAGGNALKASIIPILTQGICIIPLSTGVFADTALLEQAEHTCMKTGAKVYLPAGAVGGFDLMGAMGWDPDVKVRIHTEKPPKGLAGAPCLEGRSLSEHVPETVFTGDARAAIAAFPKNVNVAVSVGLATVGADRLSVTVGSDPSLAANRHTVCLESSLGKAQIKVEAAPSVNARSSLLAAYSVLQLLKKLDSPICFL